MKALGHKAILASAGSGKTFQLAHRYVEILAHGVSPDRIVALTFSRKAAGEMFDAIVKHVRTAAADEAAAEVMARRIGRPGLGRADFLAMLRTLVLQLSRLRVSTLDSFAVGILHSFPLELGLPLELEMMDNEGPRAEELRRDVLAGIFHQRSLRRQAQEEFQEAFKIATFGREEKGMARNLDEFLQETAVFHRLLPEGRAWGNPAEIWPEGFPWRALDGEAPDVAAQVCGQLEGVKLHARMKESLLRFAQFAGRHGDTVRLDDQALSGRTIEELLARLADLERGGATLTFSGKDYLIPTELGRGLARLARHVIAVEIAKAMRQTQGRFQLIDQYEAIYDQSVRRRGYLTFDDAQQMLTRVGEGRRQSRLTLRPGDQTRLYIDYRLDARLDHWLLDEFQDTSDVQWSVLENLIDEIVQDNSGQRSFFYVGDVKQAIYGWRGGNARLFGRILDRYGSRIERQPLSTSFRSCPAIIDFVNQAFGRLPPEFPDEVRGQWTGVWNEHAAETSVVPARGCAVILEAPADEAAGNDEEARGLATARLLAELDPIRRGLTAAVLVRTNDAAAAAVNAIRTVAPHLPVVQEGRSSVADSPVVSLFFSLLKYAEHPADTLALRHLWMSPLRAVMEPSPRALLAELYEGGFQAFVRKWGQRLAQVCPMDDFGRRRLADLGEAAAEFDRTGNRSASAFLRFCTGFTVRDAAASGAVRVMTIHQSKGLDFDIVVLPDLQGASMLGGFPPFLLPRDPVHDQPRWALATPRSVIANCDPVLAGAIAQYRAQDCFENLCVLYVAATRARKGLYMVASKPGPTSKSLNEAAFLKRQVTGDTHPQETRRLHLGELAFASYGVWGDVQWHLEETPRPADRTHAAAGAPPLLSRRPRETVTPSSRAEHARSGGLVFHTDVVRSLEWGTAIHELFEQVEWADAADADAIVSAWRRHAGAEPAFMDAVAAHFATALASPEIAAALRREQGVELWREKSFAFVHEQAWVSGTFDRVHVQRDAQGAVTGAVVVDYKSNDIADDAQLMEAARSYAPQMQMYRRALATLLARPVSAIRARLLFTQPGRVVDVEHDQLAG